MTKEWSAIILNIGVSYNEDIEKTIHVMKQVGDELMNDKKFEDKIIEPIEVLGIDSFTDISVVIQARIKTRPIEQWGVGREYRKRLKKAFDENRISLPYPQTTINFANDLWFRIADYKLKNQFKGPAQAE